MRQPRDPKKMVGRSALSRGPSEATNKSALSNSACSAQTSLKPGEPVSSPISMMNLALKPKQPRSANTQASAFKLTECWPLLSAMPRPYQRPSKSVRVQGETPSRHSDSSPRITSPWPYPRTVGKAGSSNRSAYKKGAFAFGCSMRRHSKPMAFNAGWSSSLK